MNKGPSLLLTDIPYFKKQALIYKFRKSLLGLLSQIEIEDCDQEVRENLKSVFELLTHLELDQDFLVKHKELMREVGIEFKMP